MAGELDLDAFLSDDDVISRDDDGDAIPFRTVDEILNSPSSSSSDSESETAPKPKPKPKPKTKEQIVSQSSLPAPEKLETRQETITPPVNTLRNRSTSLDLPSSSSSSSSSDTLTSLVLRGLSDRPPRPLFRGVRVSNQRPGAALAAAAAASRPVATPHAAALKLRSLQKENSGGVDEEVKKVEIEGENGASSSSFGVTGNLEELAVSENADENTKKESKGDNVDLEIETKGEETISRSSESIVEGEDMQNLNENVTLDHVQLNEKSELQERKEEVEELVNNSELVNKSELVAESGMDHGEQNLKEIQSKPTEIKQTLENLDKISPSDDEPGPTTSPTLEIAENMNEEIEKAVEIAKKAEKKFKSSMTPLEYYEETEKRQASYGLHYEEGAVAQPMRLEGIRRGPPAVGYLQIDLDNAATRLISSQGFRREHGSPQVVVVHRAYIAFGMSRGGVFVVPSKYSIHSSDNMDSKMLVFTNQGEKSSAPVTSMCFNQQGDLLLVGYGDGHLTIWDVAKLVPAKVISGEHTAPVVHALFLGQESSSSRQYKAITGDSKGFVLLHTFSVLPLLNRFTIKSQCLLEGQKNGVVLSASTLIVDEPYGLIAGASAQGAYASTSAGGLSSMMGGVVGGVLFNESGGSSGPAEEGVVIFVTHQNALVVKLGTSVEVYEKFSRPEGVREGSLPYTAWKCVPVSHDASSSGEPERVSWLAIAWDRRVQVYKLVKSELKKHKEWSIDSAAIGVAWLDDQMLVLLNTRGQLCLFTKDSSELHRTSISPHDGSSVDDIITYHTHFLNVYGNPEKSYHNSVSVRGATVYILGPMHLMVSRLLPWKERIQVLQRAGDWMGALDMAMRLYDGHTQGVVDLPRNIGDIRDAIMPFLVELLLSYVDEVFSYISVAFRGQNGKETEIEEQYARVGGVAVEYCVHISRIDILFDTVFSRFLAVHQGGSFLEILEPYILKDMLGCLPPEIMQALVEHYNKKGWLQRVEQCILHMDISSLDFNQVVKLCREHGLYGALIYLFNQGLNDYKAPLEELLSVVQSSPWKEASRICYRMLVYLKYCFQGLAFPPGHGRIPIDRIRSVRNDLLQFLLEESRSENSKISQIFKASCSICPNLCHLLIIDTAATLEVIRFSLMEPEMADQEEGLGQERLDSTLQDLTNILVRLIGLEDETLRELELDEEARVWPSQKDSRHLLQFVSYVVSHKGASVSAQCLKHVLVYLTSPEKGLAFENEKEVLRLFRVLPSTEWCSDDVLELCLKAGFHQACGLIHARRGNNVAALDCYMKDTEDPFHAFAFIDSMLSGHVLSDEGAMSFHSSVMSRFPDLVKLNRECTFFLVLDHFDGESQEILSRLHDHPQSLFLFLKTAIDVHLSGNLSIDEFHILKDDVAVNGYLERLTNNQKIGIERNPIQVSDEIIELYLELLCRYEQDSVLKFLQTFDNYRLEHCLRLCLDHGATDAAAFLLERVGDVSGALVLVMTGLDEKFESLISSLEHNFKDSRDFSAILKTKEAINVLDVLHCAIDLCQRNMHRIDPNESESLWFQLFDAFSRPLKSFSGGKRIPILRRVFSHFVGDIIEGMAGCIPLPAIMAKLLSDSGNREFGDFKLIILKMLSTYGYEKRILDTAKSVIEDDTFYTLSLLKKGVSHAFAPQNLTCCICNSSLHKMDSNPKVRLYSCGHTTHFTCESEDQHAYKPSKEHVCPVCLPKKTITAHEENALVGLYASNSKQQNGEVGVQRVYEADSLERSRTSQVSRFEILSNLQKSKKPFQMDPLPQLKLSPPVIYHETVNRSANLRGQSSNSSTVKGERSKRLWQIKDLKSKGFTTNLFGSEKSKTRWLDI
ncbi:Vacuolar protein sorting-associated protein 8-like protein [Rhynchospora pubera]|uniref:Vacuolar protein sorting-associated protein 8-like protein n=1 Tax=Rhynchospora pubera TaxID=906938 RepID=A0AAV8FNY5_9POAL|nr:Vacuolar protein sorting-associated protein 8-like protein [Rhynchospora pubera]